MKLTTQLSHSEKIDWHNTFQGHDKAQKECTGDWYTHYFVQNRGPMQEGHDPLYSHWKQSQVQHFQAELSDAQWCDWESMLEYDTDIDAAVEKLSDQLQT